MFKLTRCENFYRFSIMLWQQSVELCIEKWMRKVTRKRGIHLNKNKKPTKSNDAKFILRPIKSLHNMSRFWSKIWMIYCCLTNRNVCPNFPINFDCSISEHNCAENVKKSPRKMKKELASRKDIQKNWEVELTRSSA